MRNDLQYKGLVIGATGNALKSDIDMYISCGVNEVLVKPISFDEAELWDFTVNGKKYKARRYSKRINKADGATFDIWLDEESKIPLRYLIGLNENYGATMLFELESFKKLN
jgi:hypothetical protein